MKKLLLFTVLLVVILTSVLIQRNNSVGQSSQALAATIDPSDIGDLSIYQFTQNTKPLEGLLVSVPLNQTLDDPLNFTIYLDINGDGKFLNSEKVVENIPGPVEEIFPNAFPAMAHSNQVNRLLFNLADGASISAKIHLIAPSGDEVVLNKQAEKMQIDIGEVFDPAPGFTGGVSKQLTSSPLIAFFSNGLYTPRLCPKRQKRSIKSPCIK